MSLPYALGAAVVAGALAAATVLSGIAWYARRRVVRRLTGLGARSDDQVIGPPGRRMPRILHTAVWSSGPVRWGFVIAAAAVAFSQAGPVAGLLAAGYGSEVVRAGHRRERAAAQRRRRQRAMDALHAFAAEVRAGRPVATATVDNPALLAIPDFGAALRLAHRTGAPLVDLVERMEADLRAAERLRQAVGAQAAGAQATAWLLAALPAAGVGLGYAIGVDPGRVLLRTPGGALCAVLALSLQVSGLAWCRYLIGRAGVPARPCAVAAAAAAPAAAEPSVRSR